MVRITKLIFFLRGPGQTHRQLVARFKALWAGDYEHAGGVENLII